MFKSIKRYIHRKLMKFESYECSINGFEKLAKNHILKTLNELDQEYDSHDPYGDHWKFTGLCDAACKMIVADIEKVNNKTKALTPEIKATLIHGEQKHSRRIESKYWGAEHTWLKLQWRNMTIYVDPTCGQFEYLYDEIPDTYISVYPPPWFCPDKHNIRYTKLGVWLDNHIKIPIKVKENDSVETHRIGLLEYIQFELLGRISDFIRK